ncbi:hypothetical protein D3C85_1128950 [compost metagenome]
MFNLAAAKKQLSHLNQTIIKQNEKKTIMDFYAADFIGQRLCPGNYRKRGSL